MRIARAAAFATLLAFPVQDAAASGFQIREQSASKLGNAFAGAGSSGDDASILFYNPAGIALFDAPQAQAAVSPISPQIEFSGSATDATGGPVSRGDGGDAGSPVAVPSAYLVATISDRVNLGLALNVPFGLVTSYDDDWVGRYHAITSELQTVSITGVASLKISDRLSIGGGPVVTYAQSRLTNAIDFGSVCVGTIGLGPCSSFGALPQQADGKIDLQGSDWGMGATAGLLYEPVKGTRIGLSWRSQVRLKVEGDADFDVPANAAILTSGGAFTDSPGSAEVTLPETIGLSVHHDITDTVAVMGDVVWTGWSRFDELRFVFDNPAQPDAVTPQNWNDTIFVALGATWRPTDAWTLRTGVAYDQSPTEQNFRTPRMPDNDRYWVSLGADYRIDPRWTVSAGYTHIFVESSRMDHSEAAAGTLRGSYEGSIDVLTLGATLRF
ncbi:outer membrane protein transport protein [Thalassobaculum sp. OXR-137]|uniref:OmpP1/FadL family transporter n=1 Tax=Thalassobaculum sp. OXR-137 TaxID=3100173 RepID=UPI002AC9CF58|nr:outer membrane protein transport protein [Thalassobaculum sp. OXR-137]WPZ33709.1 outer membrane protein transport protein [Thalassobaculum sp. OXR-137]